MLNLHISRFARDRYQLLPSAEDLAANASLTDFEVARKAAENMSRVRGTHVSASDLNAIGLIHEALKTVIRQYEMENSGVMGMAASWLDSRIGQPHLDHALIRFTDDFPPLQVFVGALSAAGYLQLTMPGGVSHRQISLEDLFLLNITNQNEAIETWRELFDDQVLDNETAYRAIVNGMRAFFSGQPGMGERGENLYDLLRAPALAAPNSLTGQLNYIINRWGALLGDAFVKRLLKALDFIREEEFRGTTPFEPGSVPALSFHAEEEYERFSSDREWMPQLVLMAKSSYVWLDQLSKQYRRSITRLDQIPDEELDVLAKRGFSGLWLIGLWERSQASQKIKQIMGNHDAVASAYSLYDYEIAADLGGWDALNNLRWRAWQRGIRLSADMVPNHMGIDSRWVVEHPDWFLSLKHSPYPSYRFNEVDLCSDPRVGIYLEDHYYEKTDAAVVFKRVDHWTGDTRFIYHGNDGTSMPWNDTAQLDYSQPQVREAVIQTILHVARNFPIIRFDAAMTLAKKHIQRLWFPEPGAGGAIPSRAEYGMDRDEFEAAIPNEFWREVVDRVAAEVPDTLLLAEAFWLMEGYFVRTLGMHRVYNSAFMHMLRDEDNAKYRTVIKNVIEFEPEVLKRFVNFMNNPDEKTAIEQFGSSDKYFGVCVLLATLPGLPMFGHGQIEGYREKYGMEYRRASWDEYPDHGLTQHHERIIFPLLHRRHIFAEAENFLLFDFYTSDGHVNEDVFAFSNRAGEERGLVICHNRYANTGGWVKTSAAFMDKDEGQLVQRSLAEGLQIPRHGFVIFKDVVSQLEFIRTCSEVWEKGLFVQLHAYQHHAFLDFRFVDGAQWAEICESLHGAGVVSLQAVWDERFAAVSEPEPQTEKTVKKPAKKRATKKTTKTEPKKTTRKKKVEEE